MRPLSFNLKIQPGFTLDLSPLTPDKLAGKTSAQIKRISLQYGKQKVLVEDMFTISGDDHKNIRFTKGSENLSSVGREMSFGTIEVNGDTGNYSGQYMQGGTLLIQGNAGAWVGNRMSNGRIEIKGNVGDYLGAGLPGEPHGMSNGTIIVTGNAGDRVGDRLRRGYIIIRGKAGDYCGSRMVAGTIIVLDKIGKYPGFGMRRGTIILAKQPNHIPATFKSCGDLKMQFLRLLFKQLAELGKEYDFFNKYVPEAHRYAGDLSANGKGELLILQIMKSSSQR